MFLKSVVYKHQFILLLNKVTSNVSGRVCTSICIVLATCVVCRLLVGHGYSVNTNGANGTPLHEAALYGKTEAVKFLIEVIVAYTLL